MSERNGEPGASILVPFIDHLRYERRLSPRTLEAYRDDLEAYLAWLHEQGLVDPRRADSGHVRAYAAARHRRGPSPKSLQRALSAIRVWYRYLLREGQATVNPADSVQAP